MTKSKKLSNISQSVIFVLVILGFIAVINYLSTKKFIRMDLTEGKEYSISPASKNMLSNLDDIVNIKVYFSKNLPPHLQKLESGVNDLLEEFKAYSGRNLRISFEDPMKDEETKKKVKSLGIPEVRLKTFEKDKEQTLNAFLGIVVLYADKKEVLPVVQDLRNFEYDLAQAIMKVFRDHEPVVGVLKTDTFPKIPAQMMQRMNMKDKTEEKYKPIFDNLRKNYDVKTVDISNGQKIDSNIKTLIIPGGDAGSFTDRDLFEIDQYFMNGGNLIVLADAVKLDFQYGIHARTQEPQIFKLLKNYGVEVEKNIVLDASCGQVQIPQNFGGFQMNVAVDYPYFIRILPQGFNKDNPAVSGLADMILPWASSLKLLVPNSDSLKDSSSAPVTGQVLAHTSQNSWVETGSFNLQPQQNWRAIITSKKDDLGPSDIAVYLSGNFNSYFKGKSVPPKKSNDTTNTMSLSSDDKNRQIIPQNSNANLVVVGDADFLSSQNSAPGNIAWILNVVDWLTLDDNLISIRSRSIVDRSIRTDNLNKDTSSATFIRFINILLMPTLLVIMGLVIYSRRKEVITATPNKSTDKAKDEVA